VLTKLGQVEKKLLDNGFNFDIVFTSLLERSIITFNHVADVLKCHHIPIVKSWRLNERHYGALQGLNKAETATKYGEDQVKIWRRSFDIKPPALDPSDPRFPGNEKKYASLPKDCLPLAESLLDTINRVLLFFNDQIYPALISGLQLLISAHGNSLRAIVKHLDKLSDEEILELNIPTGLPLVYELDSNMKPIKHYYLGEEEEIKKKLASVASQGKAK